MLCRLDWAVSDCVPSASAASESPSVACCRGGSCRQGVRQSAVSLLVLAAGRDAEGGGCDNSGPVGTLTDTMAVLQSEIENLWLINMQNLAQTAASITTGGAHVMYHTKGLAPLTATLLAASGVEAAGEGVDTQKHAATITKGTPGVLHGSFSLLLQDAEGQVIDPHSISAG